VSEYRSKRGFVTDAATSRRMSGIRQEATKPELAVRKAVRELGMSYRTSNRDLPGSPDLANRSKRWAIFVHGCYWHRHVGCPRATTPTRNRALWVTKFDENVARDKARIEQLGRSGFRVLVVWECDTEEHERLKGLLRKGIPRIRPWADVPRGK
jgi:DNA mismatch endonuclease, patch repair protein